MKEIQHRSKRRRLLTPPISLVPRTQTPTISLVPRTPTPSNSPTPVDDQVQQSLFADDLGSFVNPDQRNESNMLNDRLVPTPCHLIDDGVPVTYEIVSAATNRGKPRLEPRTCHLLALCCPEQECILQGNCIRHHQECQGGRDTTFV
ncbi:hypothetical protein LSH36_204g10052 [Paralvinella palmiformis]|uniref:Uncharacterized protein n=1 Tax=Paralvinella palmiformis TaxID=53620 RepID=A0AAD9JP71_9ANNE|nr:hypothetical protein LSH36_204g10052 [Paralvinella palmiformis]